MARVTLPNVLSLNSTNVGASDYSEWSSGTTYALAANVKVTTSVPHKEYESLQAANTNHPPATSPEWWLELGATNQYKMLDSSSTSQTSNSGTIAVTLGVTGYANRLALQGMVAQTARIITKSGSTTLSDDTYDLLDNEFVSWSGYFFDQFNYRSDIAVDLNGLYPSLTVLITLTSTTTAKCGNVIAGMTAELGESQYGARAGILDYSVKTTDDFGDTVLVQRNFAKTAEAELWVSNAAINAVNRLMAGVRATPCLWDFNNDSNSNDSLIVYGFFRDYSIVLQYPTMSLCSISVEGLA